MLYIMNHWERGVGVELEGGHVNAHAKRAVCMSFAIWFSVILGVIFTLKPKSMSMVSITKVLAAASKSS